MAELLTGSQMRAIEQAAITAETVSGLDLMERAGTAVVAAIFEAWTELAAKPHVASVLCGPGNNGGDGFVIARLLQDRGWTVTAHLYGEANKLPPDARVNHDRWIAQGACVPLTEHSAGADSSTPDLVVDALFGTGLTRPVRDEPERALRNLETLRHAFGVRCVSVDIPSGLCSDSGKPLGWPARADLTVSFHAEKLGHRLEQADLHSRRIVVKDIGLPRTEQNDERLGTVWMVEPPGAADLAKPRHGHKYAHGHALVLTGGAGRTGAARLAGRAALRVGTGLVTLAVPPEAEAEVAAQITALMLTPVANADALSELLQDGRLNALCLGPGLGLDDRARALVEAVLSLARPVVLDADALSLFGKAPRDLFGMLHDRAVLTPHGGEFARLFPDLAARLNAEPTAGPAYSKVEATRAAAKRAGCTVLFKGPATVIAASDGRCSIHSAQYERAAPWLATAGTGDVLAGLVTGLLARGLDSMKACEIAAWLHTECALDFGPGLIAEDLADQVPRVFRRLGL